MFDVSLPYRCRIAIVYGSGAIFKQTRDDPKATKSQSFRFIFRRIPIQGTGKRLHLVVC